MDNYRMLEEAFKEGIERTEAALVALEDSFNLKMRNAVKQAYEDAAQQVARIADRVKISDVAYAYHELRDLERHFNEKSKGIMS
jgi:predicted nucleotidyltransferase